jgi:hypothetical protein
MVASENQAVLSAKAIRVADGRKGWLTLTSTDVYFQGPRSSGVVSRVRARETVLFQVPLKLISRARGPQLLSPGRWGYHGTLRIESIYGSESFWTSAAQDFSTEIETRLPGRQGHVPSGPHDFPGEKYRAEAYRLRTQAIADYQNAVPVPGWASYMIGLGTASFGGGSAVLVTTQLAHLVDWVAVGSFWTIGGLLIVAGLLALRTSDAHRREKYDQGLQLFEVWARSIGEPFEGTRGIGYTTADRNREIAETQTAMALRDRLRDAESGETPGEQHEGEDGEDPAT